ncbi:origin recognition complex subunit 3 [Anopheles ziemanni]|uniref:origin recognition complex subunit 3 n=1 Tax=Anopheles coustani TaxID=139045 RepID=UPI002659D4ED|nr:origin recognition complex subunit 3 [Anopheles coustani]XP_058171515.1 origin recognition complex subunit 3 [Anopheles ziemanni]
MEATNSISKGVFVFKNGATHAKGVRKAKPAESFLSSSVRRQPWYRNYRNHWDKIQTMIDEIQSSSYGKILDDLLAFIENSYNSQGYDGVLPTAALLTGINQIDHMSQFEKLASRIRSNTFSYVVLLQSRDGSNLKQAIETIVEGFVEEQTEEYAEEKLLRKNQLNLVVLKAWYLEKHNQMERKPNLTVILSDFELFNPSVLQDIIIILNSYATSLPFVLIFGVATSITTVHNVLPYHVTSKIKLSIFQSEPSITNLNTIIDNVLLRPYCPFHLSGRVFKLLLDIFLFYDFSVNRFVQTLKYSFFEHYFAKSINGLSTIVGDEDEVHEMVNQLSTAELDNIRQLPSFRPFVESLQHPQEVVDFLTNDEHLKRSLPGMLIQVHNYWFTFHCALEILQALVSDLPKAPLGKQLRELYCLCVYGDVTELPEFKECIQLLLFLSKEEMLQKVKKVLEIVLTYVSNNDRLSMEGCLVYDVGPVEQLANGLVVLSDELDAARHEYILGNRQQDQQQQQLLSPSMGRQELREKLLTAARHAKSESEVTRAVGRLVDYFVRDIFQRYLRPPNSRTVPLIELFLFSDSTTVRHHMVGTPRAAIHTALNNPQYYTQCECCVLDNEYSIVPTMPDLSIAYKLHLECGRMINLFDWMQAFRTVVEDNQADEGERSIDPKIQARFTRAVTELQFLGFIKTSKRKTDHVTRLTW